MGKEYTLTFDPKTDAFKLTKAHIKTPENGNIYSINEGNHNILDKGVQNYISYCKEINEDGNRTHTARFIGSLVADFHRNMLKEGYSSTQLLQMPLRDVWRLLYECNPIAMIAEQSGGLATCGEKRLLDIKASELHQRIPLFTGSKKMMKKAISFLS